MSEGKMFEIPFGSLLQLHIPGAEGLVEIARHIASHGVAEVKAGRWELVYVFIEWEWRLVGPSGQLWRFAHPNGSDLLRAILGTIRRVWGEAHLDAFDNAIEGKGGKGDG